MRIVCPKNLLHQATNYVLRAVSGKSGNDILDNVYLSADATKGRLTLRGYDMECGIETVIPADVQEAGDILVPARLLGDIAAKLEDGDVTIDCDDSYKTIITAGKSKFNFMTRPSTDYPSLPEIETTLTFTMPQERLQKLIKQSIIAVSTDLSRPAFNGILFNAADNNLELVAIDGFRLAISRHEYDERMNKPAENFKLLIPGKALKMLQPMLGADELLTIKVDSKQVEFNLGDVKLISRLLTNAFMKYENLLKNDGDTNIVINRSQFLAGLERMLLIMNVSDRRLPIRLQSKDENIMSIDVVSEKGQAHEDIAISATGKDIDIDYNPTYFTEALRVIEDETIQINFSGSLGPCIIKPLSGDEYEFLILPLRR